MWDNITRMIYASIQTVYIFSIREEATKNTSNSMMRCF
ncbi:hypothetical protein BBEV_1178 [Salisediminibacterium beveridgei]|uniref:Uncharacterized protein n=1 Tax=Salisediminibacterium beveridgei TaxID=632773 RepID=A0A1D7QU48_9BACI|nr:hypothetical protein BBEV_1178 [Salisediminibacterium beveridgei]